MKILQILPSLEVGGVERGVIDLVKAMKRRGEESVVVSSGGSLVVELNRMGIPHHTLPVHRKSLLSLGLVPKIARIIRQEQVDLVHARSRVPAWIAWLAAKQAGVPFITTCHGHYSVHLLSHIMGWGKRVIVISNAIGRHMIDRFGVSPERIRLVHRGVDISQFRKKTKSVSAERSSKTMRIINVGRLSPIKGQIEFLKAVHLLRSRFQPIEVWLVGAEGKGKTKYTERIRDTIKHLGLESCVQLLGTRRDVPELLAQSDLLVLSTLVPEGFGRVLIEAGAIGVPVVSTKVGGVMDIVEDGKDGLLVGAGDIDGLASAMFRALSDEKFACRLSENLMTKVQKQFTLEHMVDRELEVCAEVKIHKKILMIKLGAMGDVILSVPSMRMIRERYPDAFISVMVDKKIAPLVSNSPYVNEVIPVERHRLQNLPYLLKTAKKIKREAFDWSVDLQNSKWTHLLAFLAQIPERFGFYKGKLGFLLNRPDHAFDVVEPPVRHQFRILSKLGVHDMDDRLELWPDPQAEVKINQLLQENGKEHREKKIGLVIGSSPKWPTKRWPMQNFVALIERLLANYACKIVLIGSPEDQSVLNGQTLFQHEKVINMIGQTSARELVALMKRLDVVVTGDTAPLHVAGAFDKKIVALFGPTDPQRHMPPGHHSVVLHRSLSCQPCYEGSCQIADKFACLTQISVNEVFDAVKRQLSE